LQRSPDPVAGLRSPNSKGRETERGGEGKEGGRNGTPLQGGDKRPCRPQVGERSIAMSMSVHLSVRAHIVETTSSRFTTVSACCLWLLVGLSLAALRYVEYFRLSALILYY